MCRSQAPARRFNGVVIRVYERMPGWNYYFTRFAWPGDSEDVLVHVRNSGSLTGRGMVSEVVAGLNICYNVILKGRRDTIQV